MYSVVLMVAMTGGADTADFGHRCSGCSGCHGGCSGAVSHGCSGCSGCHGCHGSRGGLFHRRSCHGCHGCHGGCSGYTGCCGAVVSCTGCTGGAVYGPGPTGGTGGGVIIEKGGKEMPKGGERKAPATIVVNVPEGAVLTIDGNTTRSTDARRVFTTPNLDINSEYVYTFRAEVVREGRTVVETQNVTVRGGSTTEVPFSFTSTGVASR